MRTRNRINWKVSDAIRRFLKTKHEVMARLRGERFYCDALSGRSAYNITVNWDGTLTCNCHDYDGSGNIGDLNQQTSKEAFYGPKAQALRESLAQGKLPILTCAHCGDLKRIKKSKLPEI